MAKNVVYNEADPEIGMVLEMHAGGWIGRCTECGHTVFKWDQDRARQSAQAHVDSHEI